MITDRQKNILNELVKLYINNAKPVSSELLEEKSKLDFCPATIRGEMKRLTDMGYLKQPHTSAGRVPTNKGYRFFVDSLNTDINSGINFEFESINDDLKLIETITRNMALLSSSLVFTYLNDKDFLWKDGWKEVFNNPEFKEPDFLSEFLETVDHFEKNIKKFNEEADQIRVYIGDEKPFQAEDFSLIISKTRFPNQDGILAILGPNRMAYDKNIELINSLIKEISFLSNAFNAFSIIDWTCS